MPHVYVALRDGDLSPSGALLSGNSVDIHTTADLTNSGTILGRRLVSIDSQNLNNQLGQIGGNDVVLKATQDINNVGGSIGAQNSLTLDAGRDINVTSTVQSSSGSAGAYSYSQSGIDRLATLYVKSRAADLSAQGALSIAAQGNILLDAGQTQTNYDTVMTRSSSGFLSSTTTRTQTQSSSATAQASTLQGKSISVIADQNLVSVGTVLKGTDSVYVEGKDTTALYATTNTAQSSTSSHSSSSFLGINLEDKTSTDSKVQSTSIGTRLVSTQKVEIGIGNKAELQGTDIEAPQIAFTKIDPSKAGELILGGSTNTTQTGHTENNETLGVYQEAKGADSTTQTLNQTTLKGNVTFDTGLKISVQIPKDAQATAGGQALAAQVQTLQQTLGSNSTGLAYLNQLAANPKVQWDKVALAQEHWSYEQAGLTPAGVALLSIAIAAYTGGMGVEALGGTGSTLAGTALTTTTAAGAVTTTALGAAVNAGFASLASQAAVAMVNNQGDIGKTLQQLGSEQSVKGLLTTMVTAGALQSLDKALGFSDSTLTETEQSGTGSLVNSTSGIASSQAANQFAQNLLKNVTNNVAGAAIDSAINGKPFDEKALSSALSSALITTGLVQGANAIGDARVDSTLNDFTSKVAHAVLGCAGGAATGGGCAAGAVGAVVGELTAEYARANNMSDAQALALAKTLAAASGVLAGGGGDNVAAVNAAATTGANAAENNILKHAQALAMQREFDACKTQPGGCSAETTKAIVSKYLKLSNDNIAEVQNCIARGDAQCITNATKDAALSSEVAVTGVGGAAQVFESRADLVRNGTIATGTMSDQQLAQKVAGVRQQVCGGLSASACDTKINQLKGEEQIAALKLFGAAMAGTPLAKALIEAAPALAAAAKITVEACVASPVLCANQAGIAVGDLIAGDALGGATVAAGAATAAGKTASKLEQDIAAIRAANAVPAVKPQTYSKVEDLFGQTFTAIPLSHTSGAQDGSLGEQLALQLLNEKTGLNFKPLQNASNHGCDGCAIAINGDTITVVVADAKSSQNGVNAAASATGDPAARLQGWLSQQWAKSSENDALRAALQAALDAPHVQVKGITVKVGVPAPGNTGTATFKVEPWTK